MGWSLKHSDDTWYSELGGLRSGSGNPALPSRASYETQAKALAQDIEAPKGLA